MIHHKFCFFILCDNPRHFHNFCLLSGEENLHLPSLDGRSIILIKIILTLREWCSYLFFTPSRSLRDRIHTPSRRLHDGVGILALRLLDGVLNPTISLQENIDFNFNFLFPFFRHQINVISKSLSLSNWT